jgi:hypothetical protein
MLPVKPQGSAEVQHEQSQGEHCHTTKARPYFRFQIPDCRLQILNCRFRLAMFTPLEVGKSQNQQSRIGNRKLQISNRKNQQSQIDKCKSAIANQQIVITRHEA